MDATVGGHSFTGHARGLPLPIVMILNDDGEDLGLPFNPVASYFHGTQRHGEPILGTVVLLRECVNQEGFLSITGLLDRDIPILMGLVDGAKRSPLPEDPREGGA